MRGHISRRGDTWTVYYDRPRGPEGKRRKTSKGEFHTRKEGERWLRRTLGSLDDGTFVEPSKLTLGEFLLNEWLPALEVRELRPSTRASYRSTIKTYVVPRLGDVPMQRLAPPHLNALYAELSASGRARRVGGLSARSVRYVHTILRRALADAVKWDRVTRNVADSADPPGGQRRTRGRRTGAEHLDGRAAQHLPRARAAAPPRSGVPRGSDHRYATRRSARAPLA